METTFDSLVYESDESNVSKASTSSRGRRRSTRCLKTDAPTRRSSRISTIQMAAEIEKSISIDLDDSSVNGSEKSTKSQAKRKRNRKPVSTDDNELEKILGVAAIGGQLQFVMKWKNRDEPTIVPNDEAKLKHTYAVLDFYESYMCWNDDDDDNGDNDGNCQDEKNVI